MAKKRSLFRTLMVRLFQAVGLVTLVFLAVVVVTGWTAFGKVFNNPSRARMEKSPQWKDGVFVNPQPIINDYHGMIDGLGKVSAFTTPLEPIGVQKIDPASLKELPASGLRITWLGHGANLIELDGVRVLTDPVWGERASPLSWLGPKRWFEPPIALDALPQIDAVVISHDHYDHLDAWTMMAMKNWDKTKFIVPLGIRGHLLTWGIPDERIVEVDWWDHTRINDVDIVCVPARHASGRTAIFDKDATLWAGYAIVGNAHRAYYSGDTGIFPAMKDIGDKLGPFDVTMIEAGQYHRAWPDWHIGPEQAVQAHQMVRGKVMIPVHWSLFTLAYHGWTEPVERVLAAAKAREVDVLVPMPGQSVEPTVTPHLAHWWPKVPWQTADESPIVSSGMP